MEMKGLNDLPDDVLLEIFNKLTWYERFPCDDVCQRWRQIVSYGDLKCLDLCLLHDRRNALLERNDRFTFWSRQELFLPPIDQYAEQHDIVYDTDTDENILMQDHLLDSDHFRRSKYQHSTYSVGECFTTHNLHHCQATLFHRSRMRGFLVSYRRGKLMLNSFGSSASSSGRQLSHQEKFVIMEYRRHIFGEFARHPSDGGPGLIIDYVTLRLLHLTIPTLTKIVLCMKVTPLSLNAVRYLGMCDGLTTLIINDLDFQGCLVDSYWRHMHGHTNYLNNYFAALRSSIEKMSRLEHLECAYVCGGASDILIPRKLRPTMKTLKTRNMSLVTLALNFPHLEYLEIKPGVVETELLVLNFMQSNETPLTNAMIMHDMADNRCRFIKLRKFALGQGTADIHCLKASSLSLFCSRCPVLEDIQLEVSLTGGCAWLLKLPNMRRLTIPAANFDFWSLKESICGIVELQLNDVDLDNCKRLLDFAMVYLPGLKNLRMSTHLYYIHFEGRNISATMRRTIPVSIDKNLFSLFILTTEFKVLDVNSGQLRANRGMNDTQIASLYVSGMVNTCEAILYVAESMPKLQYLTLRDCSPITLFDRFCIERLFQECINLKVIELIDIKVDGEILRDIWKAPTALETIKLLSLYFERAEVWHRESSAELNDVLFECACIAPCRTNRLNIFLDQNVLAGVNDTIGEQLRLQNYWLQC